MPGYLPCLLIVLNRSLGLELSQQAPEFCLPRAIDCRFDVPFRLLPLEHDPIRFLFLPLKQVSDDLESLSRPLKHLPAVHNLLPHLKPFEDFHRTLDYSQASVPLRNLAFHLPRTGQADAPEVGEAFLRGRVTRGHLVDQRLELEGRTFDCACAVCFEART